MDVRLFEAPIEKLVPERIDKRLSSTTGGILLVIFRTLGFLESLGTHLEDRCSQCFNRLFRKVPRALSAFLPAIIMHETHESVL